MQQRPRRVVTGVAVLALLTGAALPADAQSLRGSRASVRRMHRYATAHQLHFHRTSRGIRSAGAEGRLVRLRATRDVALHDVSHPYARPATALFLERLAAQYRAACGERLVVTSGTRPLSVRLPNGSARSVHPTGMAVDVRRPRGQCLVWLRRTLLSLERQGVLDATEERRPPHFHVAVFAAPYRRYLARRGVSVSARPRAARARRASSGGR